ncbi:MAG: UTP--glucose-1-phosphate uridylyltransferase GalU, partial [Lentisphaerae bacterium]|nr:UTP--glucose-1-phosphate uridylyltransferase GalU [Lentisphaerota bacterium]
MIRKAVIPAAGFGTRFLPVSKSQPKEMLPIVDKPVIQYVVEEAVASGITDILMIIGKSKRAIEEYFDRNFELEHELISKNKEEDLEILRKISDMANVHFVWQKQLNGLGDAVMYAADHVGDEPFALLLGDTLVESDTPVTKQLMDEFAKRRASVVALEEVPKEKVSRYGVMAGECINSNLYRVNDFVEKPKQEEAPSNLAIAGRYVFTPDLFDFIRKLEPGLNNEIQLTDAMKAMAVESTVFGLRFDGIR